MVGTVFPSNHLTGGEYHPLLRSLTDSKQVSLNMKRPLTTIYIAILLVIDFVQISGADTGHISDSDIFND